MVFTGPSDVIRCVVTTPRGPSNLFDTGVSHPLSRPLEGLGVKRGDIHLTRLRGPNTFSTFSFLQPLYDPFVRRSRVSYDFGPEGREERKKERTNRTTTQVLVLLDLMFFTLSTRQPFPTSYPTTVGRSTPSVPPKDLPTADSTDPRFTLIRRTPFRRRFRRNLSPFVP